MPRRGAYPRRPPKNEQAKIDAFLADWNEKARKRTAAFEETCERLQASFPDAGVRESKTMSGDVYKREYHITASNGLTNVIAIER